MWNMDLSSVTPIIDSCSDLDGTEKSAVMCGSASTEGGFECIVKMLVVAEYVATSFPVTRQHLKQSYLTEIHLPPSRTTARSTEGQEPIGVRLDPLSVTDHVSTPSVRTTATPRPAGVLMNWEILLLSRGRSSCPVATSRKLLARPLNKATGDISNVCRGGEVTRVRVVIPTRGRRYRLVGGGYNKPGGE